MTCPSCRAGIAAGASRCGACGALVAIPTEGALAPDLSRMREIPGLRKQPRTWKDEVKERVQTRRAARTSPAETPNDSAPAEDEMLVEQRAPEGTLVELGGEGLLSDPSPYAVTEKFDRPMDLGDDEMADLPLGPPPVVAPRVEAAPRSEPVAARPELAAPMPPRVEAPLPRVHDEARPVRSAPEPRWDPALDESASEEAAVIDGLAPAPLPERALAAAIDLTLWTALSVLVLYFASRVAHVPLAGLSASWPWVAAFLGFLGIVYGAWFTGTTGQTVGKIATGLRVVDEDGRPPGAARALVRAAAGLLGIVALGGGLVPVLLDPQRRALHDRLASTRVVRA